ncbi:MAG: hypothetical protein KGN84_23020, partial [Acidobacteriota bacterium]|nr:hypothetical protein [Acidobacteriota bacterium]
MKANSRIFLLIFGSGAMAQTPAVTSGGVVSAASWSSPVAPGQLAAIFGTNLAATTAAASAPYPNSLAGTSVTIDGVPAPIQYVSPTQVNVQAPASLTIVNYDVRTAHVVVTTSAGSSAATALSLANTFPGFFTADGSGCGQASALNIPNPFFTGINSHDNSAAPGDYIALFGTGFGLAAAQPADGTAPSDPTPLNMQPSLLVDSNPVTPIYAGLAPGLAGVDQINFQLPATTRNGCAVPVSATAFLSSSPVTLSVQRERGKCTDPPIQSYGQVTLYKAAFFGSPAPPPSSDAFAASFPSSPGLQPPAPPEIVYAPVYKANVPAGGPILIATDGAMLTPRTCGIPGYTHLSAGTIQIQPPTGAPATSTPQPLLTGGVSYGATLPDGFIGPGNYAFSGTGDIQLHASLTVGPPIQLQTTFAAGAVIHESQPLTVTWTGGDTTELVKVTLISSVGRTRAADYTYAPATAGSITIQPFCTGGPRPSICTMGLSASDNAQIVVDVIPAPDRVMAVQVPGVTGPVQLSYQ